MALQLPDGTWLSVDRFWRYSGGRWTPVVPPATGRPGLFWFLRSPDWFSAMLISGLIALIPVAGLMNLYGWSLATASNLRAGYHIAAPANFEHIARGVRYFAWGCIVGLCNFVMAAVVALVAGALTYAVGGQWSWTIAIGAASALTSLSVVGLVLAPLTVPVLRLIDQRGLAAALKPRLVADAVSQNWDAAWYGALANLTWIVLYIGAQSVGAFVPLLGFIAGLLLAVPAYGVLGLMLAAPLARFGDAPATFDRTHTRLVLAAYAAYTAVIVLVGWGVALFIASVVR
jgi:hypothetical protein